MHHANLLIGTKNWGLSQIPESEQIEGPDISIMHYDRMSVAQARTLIYEAGLRPMEREYRTFVLVCDSILHEAQNTLLKLFEEPNAHTIFYLIVPRADILLPTLRSRCNLLGEERNRKTEKVFKEFLELSYAQRLQTIAERLTAEDTLWLNELLQGLELYAEKSKDTTLIRETLMLMSYIHTSGSSKKMLLEHIALTL